MVVVLEVVCEVVEDEELVTVVEVGVLDVLGVVVVTVVEVIIPVFIAVLVVAEVVVTEVVVFDVIGVVLLPDEQLKVTMLTSMARTKINGKKQ